ncbi:MAG: hypothetical protein P8I43_05720 [Bacteroidia bacterium]|nr:hypothetical protein [Bacteroidia bacterium]
MRIGSDFKKVTFVVEGWQLLEPNALIGDTLLAMICFGMAVTIYQWRTHSLYFKYWIGFFVIFGCSLLLGGIGHTMFNYWGVRGKYFSWFSSLISLYLLERAVISKDRNLRRKRWLTSLAKFKVGMLIAAEVMVVSIFDLSIDSHLGLLVPSIATATSLLIYCGFVALQLSRNVHPSFRHLSWALMSMLPTAVIQGFKISIHPLFDRNDLSHICLMLMLIFFWKSIRGYYIYLTSTDESKIG